MTTLGVIVLAVLLVIDWVQTLSIARSTSLHETNPVLGPHPSPWRVHLWFTLTLWALGFAVWLLPRDWLHFILVTGIALEAVCTINNWRLGVRV